MSREILFHSKPLSTPEETVVGCINIFFDPETISKESIEKLTDWLVTETERFFMILESKKLMKVFDNDGNCH